MKNLILICFVFSLFFLFIDSANATNENNDIYFQIPTLKFKSTNKGSSLQNQPHVQSSMCAVINQEAIIDETFEKIDAKNLGLFVKKIRDSICEYLDNGSIRVWVRVNAEGHIFIVTAGANLGMEVTVNCKRKVPAQKR